MYMKSSQIRISRLLLAKQVTLLVALLAACLLLAYDSAANAAAMAPQTDPFVSEEIVISARDEIEYNPSIAYNSKHNEFLVVWEHGTGGGLYDIYAQRIGGKGELLSWFAVSFGSENRRLPSVAYDETQDRYLVVWVMDSTDWDVYGRFIPWEGPDPGLSEFPIIQWGSDQWRPQVAYGLVRNEFLVVWTNTAPFVPTYLSGRLVKADGSGFSNNGNLITSGTDVRDNPGVAYNLARNEYLVTWDLMPPSGNRDIYGVRLRADAAPLGGGEFPIAAWPDDENLPSVAACREADKYLVAWQSEVSPGDWAIYAYPINGDGTLDAPPLQVDNTTSPERSPAVACSQGGHSFLVAYEQMYTNGKYGITARQVNSDHSMKPAFVVTAAYSDRWAAAVAGGRTSFLLAWSQERAGGGTVDIYGKLTSAGKVFLPVTIR